jgi:hypothetical protein
MEQIHIRKELADVMLCVETLLSLIRKGAPLRLVEAQLILQLADTLRDGVSLNQRALCCRVSAKLR